MMNYESVGSNGSDHWVMYVLDVPGITKGKFGAWMALGGQELQELYYSIDETVDVESRGYKEAILKLDE